MMTYFTTLAGWTGFQGPRPISRLRRIGEPSELHSGVEFMLELDCGPWQRRGFTSSGSVELVSVAYHSRSVELQRLYTLRFYIHYLKLV